MLLHLFGNGKGRRGCAGVRPGAGGLHRRAGQLQAGLLCADPGPEGRQGGYHTAAGVPVKNNPRQHPEKEKKTGGQARGNGGGDAPNERGEDGRPRPPAQERNRQPGADAAGHQADYELDLRFFWGAGRLRHPAPGPLRLGHYGERAPLLWPPGRCA